MKTVTIIMCILLMIMVVLDSLPKNAVNSMKKSPVIYMNDSGVIFIEFDGRQIVL